MKRVIFLIICFVLISKNIFCAEESISVTTYYPSPVGDYDEVRSNNAQALNTISNPNPSVSNPSFISDFREVNINKGLRVFGDIVGDFSGSVATDANDAGITAVSNLSYIEADAENQNFIVAGKGASSVEVVLDQETVGSDQASGIKIMRDGVEKRFLGRLASGGDSLVFNRDGSINDMVIYNTGEVALASSHGSFGSIYLRKDTAESAPQFTMVNTATANTAGLKASTPGFLLANQTGGFKFIEGTTNIFTMTNDGKVGIGTDSPEEALHLAKDYPNPIIELLSTVNSTAATNSIWFCESGVQLWQMGKLQTDDFMFGRFDGTNYYLDSTFTIDLETNGISVGTDVIHGGLCVDGIILVKNPGTSPTGTSLYLAANPGANPGSLIIPGSTNHRWDIQVRSDKHFYIVDNSGGYINALKINSGNNYVGMGRVGSVFRPLDVVGALMHRGATSGIEMGSYVNGSDYTTGINFIANNWWNGVPREVFNITTGNNVDGHGNCVKLTSYSDKAQGEGNGYEVNDIKIINAPSVQFANASKLIKVAEIGFNVGSATNPRPRITTVTTTIKASDWDFAVPFYWDYVEAVVPSVNASGYWQFHFNTLHVWYGHVKVLFFKENSVFFELWY